MNDLQFYLAVGLPIALNLSAITISFLALNKRIEDMRDVVRAETKAESAVLRGEMTTLPWRTNWTPSST